VEFAMPFAKHAAVALAAALTLIAAPAGLAAGEVPEPTAKVDNGLGELPPYTQWNETWMYAIPADSIDNGLGEMPDVSRITEVWLYAIPAEKVDSGLGEIVARSTAAGDRR
jgi:hypothetical protein